MAFQLFTDRARMVVVEARAEAAESGHGAIGTEHVLIGMLRAGAGIAGALLGEFGVTLEAVRDKVAPAGSRSGAPVLVEPAAAPTAGDFSSVRDAIEASFAKVAPRDPAMSPVFTPQARDVLRYASDAAEALRHRYIGTEHLLLGLLREGDSLACETLAGLGVDLGELARQVRVRVAPEQTRLQESFKRFNDLAGQLRGYEPDEPRLADARALRAKTMKDARIEESRAVAEAAIRFANRLDAVSERLEAALRAAAGPPG